MGSPPLSLVPAKVSSHLP
uniref:Uncharacterized protein n=1 Tax=Anguilla anguilla TaxID=7936 RepID=A0A0E9UIM3_ANGAN